MRKLIVVNIMSVDGFVEGPGKNVMALPFDPAFDEYNLEVLRQADALLYGKTTFVQSLGYWPTIADDETKGDVEREVSRLLNDLDKTVVSDTLTDDETGVWAASTTIVGRVKAAHTIAALKNKPGKNIVVFGSRTLWNNLLVAGLVDEVHLMIGPAFLGAGTPVFGGGAPVSLRLLGSRSLDNSPLILVRYATNG